MAFRRWHRWSLLGSPAAPQDPRHGSNGAWDTSRCIEVSEASRGAYFATGGALEGTSGWCYQPLWKNTSQLGLLFPIYGKIKSGKAM